MWITPEEMQDTTNALVSSSQLGTVIKTFMQEHSGWYHLEERAWEQEVETSQLYLLYKPQICVYIFIANNNLPTAASEGKDGRLDCQEANSLFILFFIF